MNLKKHLIKKIGNIQYIRKIYQYCGYHQEFFQLRSEFDYFRFTNFKFNC